MKLNQTHYKEKQPLETVAYLQKVLKENNIEVAEDWLEESCVGTHSLRLTVKGTDIGTNGKGCTREYAAASAYGEFFERLQNGILCNAMGSPRKNEKFDFLFDPNEKILSSMELVKQNDPYMHSYFKVRNLSDSSEEERAEAYRNVNKHEYLLYGMDDAYTCVPFYNLRDKKIYNLPLFSIRQSYGSNGMSAGNTPEEALVQALSEIVERYVQQIILTSKIALPNVPDEYIKKFPYVYDMYTKMKKIEGYSVFMKDCSLGGKYPVAALIVINKNTGKYGLKMGCHPDFGVAMERTFTEAAQGNDILEYSERSHLDFFNSNVDNADNIMNSFKIGLAQYPYEIFKKTPDYEFTPVKDVSNMTHKEILDDWVSEFLNDGHEILVRDLSNLGLPTYHIIVPGMSELKNHTDKELRADNTRAFASILLANISGLTKEKCKYVTGTIAFYSNKILENGLGSMIPEAAGLNLPFGDKYPGSVYLAAMCYALCGEYQKAYNQIYKLCSYLDTTDYFSKEDVIKANAIRHYFASRCNGNTHEVTISILDEFFDKKIIDNIDDIFKDESKILIKQYPDIHNLVETDSRFEPYRIGRGLIDVVRAARLNNNIDQHSLENIFNN